MTQEVLKKGTLIRLVQGHENVPAWEFPYSSSTNDEKVWWIGDSDVLMVLEDVRVSDADEILVLEPSGNPSYVLGHERSFEAPSGPGEFVWEVIE